MPPARRLCGCGVAISGTLPSPGSTAKPQRSGCTEQFLCQMSGNVRQQTDRDKGSA
jgi:hypothetical protein